MISKLTMRSVHGLKFSDTLAQRIDISHAIANALLSGDFVIDLVDLSQETMD
jgi:hypothetical protein